MLELLVTLIVLAVVFGLVFWLLQQLPLPAPWGTVVRVLAVLVAIVLLLGLVFGGTALPRMHI